MSPYYISDLDAISPSDAARLQWVKKRNRRMDALGSYQRRIIRHQGTQTHESHEAETYRQSGGFYETEIANGNALYVQHPSGPCISPPPESGVPESGVRTLYLLGLLGWLESHRMRASLRSGPLGPHSSISSIRIRARSAR